MDKWGKYGALAAIAAVVISAIGLLIDTFRSPPEIIVRVDQATQSAAVTAPAPEPKPEPQAATPEPQASAPLESNAAQATAVAPVDPPDTEPLALPASAAIDAETAGIWTDGHRFRVFEDTTTTVCPGATGFRFSVAKQGTQAAQAIYYRTAGSDQKAETGTEFLLAEGCQLRLERTGKTTDFFAEFTYLETTQ